VRLKTVFIAALILTALGIASFCFFECFSSSEPDLLSPSVQPRSQTRCIAAMQAPDSAVIESRGNRIGGEPSHHVPDAGQTIVGPSAGTASESAAGPVDSDNAGPLERKGTGSSTQRESAETARVAAGRPPDCGREADPAAAAVPESTVIPEGMVLVPEGEFTRATFSADGCEIVGWEKKTLPSFLIDRCEVTRSQLVDFTVMANYEPTHKEGWDRTLRLNKEKGYSTAPADRVSLEDAMAYARWVGKRLPTDDEWEKAARGTDGRRFPWGNEGTSGGRQSSRYDPVGMFPKGSSPYGCMDMGGGVDEWVLVEGQETQAATDGTSAFKWALRNHTITDRALPGIVFFSDDAARKRRDSYTGFRCAKSVEKK